MRQLTLSLFAACIAGLSAAPLTPQQALQRAAGDDGCLHIVGRNPQQSLRLTYTLSATDADEPVCYVYTTAADGFVMLSADDRAVPVLGYGDTPFDASEMPDGLRFMLDMYADEVRHAQPAVPGLRRIDKIRAEHEPIAPWLKTKWDQESPYNLLCPKQNGRRCYTGCVATAMAQVANYYQWPQGQCEGVKTYEWEGQELTFDFGETTFDWENMLDTYPSTGNSLAKPSCAAVATLMYGIGVASEMIYSTSGSGAYDQKAMEGMKTYLKYNPNAYLAQRMYYGTTEWEDLVYANLQRGPVYYSGSVLTASGEVEAGHAFVCDGYSADGYFHINWGWSGVSDGYFLLSALNPTDLGAGGGSGSYNYMQYCAVDFVPADADRYESTPHYGMYMYTDFAVSPEEAALGTSVSYRLSTLNESTANMPAVIVGLRIESADGESYYLKSNIVTELKVNYGFRNTKFTSTLPETLADGMYTVRPGFYDPDDQWHDIRGYVGRISYVYMEVDDDTVRFQSPDPAMLDGGIIEVDDKVMSDTDFDVKVQLTNSTDEEFYNQVLILLFDQDVELLGASGYAMAEVLPGVTKDMVLTANFKDITAGTYYLCLATEYGEYYLPIGGMVQVEMVDKPEGPLTVKVNNPSVDATVDADEVGSLNIAFDAVCSQGAGTINLGIGIFDASWVQIYTDYGTANIYKGQTRRCTFDATIDNVTEGSTYHLFYGWYDDSGAWVSYDYHDFKFTASGIADIEVDDLPGSIELYDMLGHKVRQVDNMPVIRVVTYPDGTRKVTKERQR